tara:strand:- start:815 stop:1069 length:255 start_codon:yes stop_codon:yes gene_type:complete
MFDFNSLTRKFILGEAKAAGVASYIQNLSELLSQIRPKTKTDSRRMDIAKENLREIKRHVRKLEEKVNILEEHITVLEESRNKK